MLIGPTGVGKSEALDQTADHLKVDCIVRDLSLMEAPDLTGIPVIKGDRTSYAPPEFLPKPGGRGGLLVFEELNRTPRHTQTPCLQLLTTRRLNDYTLPPNWLPVAAINPHDNGEYCGVDEMDKALLARFMLIEVEPDVGCWVKWAAEAGVHPTVQEFVRATPRIFDAAKSNPRAWKYVSDLLTAFEVSGTTKNTLIAAVAGFVGDKLATAFLRTYRGSGIVIPSAETVLRSYSRIRTQVQEWATNGNTAKLNAIVHGVLLHLQDPSNDARAERSSKSKSNLVCLLEDLPAEFRKRLTESVTWLPPTKKRKKTA